MSDGTDRKKPLSFIGPMTNVHTHASGVLLTALYNLSEDELQYWGANKNFLTRRLQDALKVDVPYAAEKEYWRKFYQKYFQLNVNFSITRIPARPLQGEWRLIFVASGLTMMQVYMAMSKAFKTRKKEIDDIDNLDIHFVRNARDTKNAYAIWVRVGNGPDEKFLGQPAGTADLNMIRGVTLVERMLLEIIYFDETGENLDQLGVTYCSGSRDSIGNVAVVRRVYPAIGGPFVLVSFYSMYDCFEYCGIREAVWK